MNAIEINPFILVYGILFFTSLIVFPIWLYKRQNKLSEKLSIVKKLAEDAKTHEELYNAWSKLVKVSKECWYIQDTIKIIEIKTIIITKRDLL